MPGRGHGVIARRRSAWRALRHTRPTQSDAPSVPEGKWIGAYRRCCNVSDLINIRLEGMMLRMGGVDDDNNLEGR
jgi:hypothetical protein